MCLLNAAKVTLREKSHNVIHLIFKNFKEQQLNILEYKKKTQTKMRKGKNKIK